MIRFTVNGPPVALERARRGRNRKTGEVHWYTPAKSAAYEKHVGMLALAARPRGWSLDGDFAIEVVMFMPDRRHRDWDNCTKALQDAMNEIAYRDDTQVVEAHVFKFIDRDRPRVEVMVRRVTRGAA